MRGVALLGAGGLGHNRFIAVAGSLDLTGFKVVAGGALALFQTGIITVCLGLHKPVAHAVTVGLHIGVHIAVAADAAGVRGVALLGAGGLGHNRLVVVANRFQISTDSLRKNQRIAIRRYHRTPRDHAVLVDRISHPSRISFKEFNDNSQLSRGAAAVNGSIGSDQLGISHCKGVAQIDEINDDTLFKNLKELCQLKHPINGILFVCRSQTVLGLCDKQRVQVPVEFAKLVLI